MNINTQWNGIYHPWQRARYPKKTPTKPKSLVTLMSSTNQTHGQAQGLEKSVRNAVDQPAVRVAH